MGTRVKKLSSGKKPNPLNEKQLDALAISIVTEANALAMARPIAETRGGVFGSEYADRLKLLGEECTSVKRSYGLIPSKENGSYWPQSDERATARATQKMLAEEDQWESNE